MQETKENQFEVIRDIGLTLLDVVRGEVEEEYGEADAVDFFGSMPFGPNSAPKPGDKPVVCLYLYQIQRSTSIQKMKNPMLREVADNGDLLEYKQHIPLYLTLRYMLTVFGEDPEEEERLLGLALRSFHDRSQITEETAVGKAIYWEERPSLQFDDEFDLDRQQLVWRTIGLPFRPAVGYKIEVRLDSARKTLVRRVEKRVFDIKRVES